MIVTVTTEEAAVIRNALLDRAETLKNLPGLAAIDTRLANQFDTNNRKRTP